MHAANGLFVDKDVPTGESFLTTLAKHYGTGVYPVDFGDEGATKPAVECVAPVDRNTGGRIKEAPAKYDPRGTRSACSIPCILRRPGRAPFDPGSTSDLPFTLAGGEQIDVPAMHNLLGDEVRGRGRLAGCGPSVC